MIYLVTIETLEIGGHPFTAVTVALPKTTLLTVSNDNGYIMCGALDVGLLNSKLADRRILAGRAVGVKTIEQLLEAPLESITIEAEAIGIYPGMIGKDALLKMI
ncbi:YunC family protein [Lysinibacillus sp. 3P01SB]|uniref:YunC family protein n=1 Tax=Lysinibacillus sp. 3P01SB TaxID=3132284 RepID=UPI0039A7792F